MRYLSVCSGIESATQAWAPLGWQCAGVSEIEPFPRAVLEQRLGAVPVEFADHRWQPGGNITPLFGDFTRIEDHHVGPIDLLVGGTPCQSFSIAGKRLGLDDPRGNLTLEFLALARRVRPRWLVWENVTGLLSHDEGRTMGTFLRLVGECGFRWAYRVLDAQYVRVDRFGRAVPQRRRRVFLVGYSGAAGIDPRAVLFDRESLRGNPAPRREAGQGASADVAPSLVSSGRGVERCGETRGQDPVVAQAFGGGNCSGPVPVAAALAAHGRRQDFEVENFVAYAPRGEGFDASEDGTGRGTPLVPCFAATDQSRGTPIAIQERAVSENPNAGPDGKGWRDDGAAYTLEARATVQAVAFAENSRAELRLCGGDGLVSARLTTGGGKPGQGQPCVVEPFTIMERGRDGEQSLEHRQDGTSNAILTPNGGRGGMGVGAVAATWGVRRLTPTECARLQGFPDDWARIAWRGKPADQCPDGPQYRAYGNSMAVNVMAWIGERIAAVESLTQRSEAA